MGITIKGAMTVDVQAALKVAIKSDLMATVQALMTEVKADAMLTLKGGITMIN
jgi:hypothetical protein